MGEKTQNSEQIEGKADAAGADGKAADTAAVTAEDLDLIPAGLEDEGKDDEEIWEEIDAQETAEANGEDDAGDKLAASADADADSGASDEDQEGSKGEVQPDPADKLWEGANEDQRAAFNAAQDQIKKLEQSDRSQRGRVSTLQRQVNDITRQLDRAAKAPDDASGAADAGEAAKGFLDSKDWKDFAGEYPEVASPLGKVIADLQKQVTGFATRQDAIEDDRQNDVVAEQTELLEKEHSDWLDAATDPMFEPWLADQPRHIREAAVRNAKEIVDAREAADVVGRFKAFRSEQGEGSAGPVDADGEKPPDNQETVTDLSEKRKRQLESSASARGKGAGAATGIPEDGDEEAIWKAIDVKEERERRQA